LLLLVVVVVDLKLVVVEVLVDLELIYQDIH
jgi:hypothetical protein